MTWGAVGGAAVSAVGGYLSSRSGSTQTIKPKLWDVNTGLGSVDVDNKKRTMNVLLSPEMQGYANQFSSIGNQYLGGQAPTQGTADYLMQFAGGQMPVAMQQYLAASAQDPAAFYSRFDQQANALGGQLQQQAGALTNAGYGQLAAGGNLLGFGMDALYNGGVGGNLANEMAAYGRQYMNAAPQSYEQVYQDRLNSLRQAAAPFEERAGLALQQNLFNTGRLGTTGGSQNVEAFARGLGQADTQRAIDAMGFSEQLYGRDLQAALQRNALGANLFGGALSGLQQGYGQAAQLAGYGGNLYGAGANTLGNSANILGGYLPQLFGAQLGAGQQYNSLVNDRALQRLSNVQQLFGFGSDINSQNLTTGTNMVNNVMGINAAAVDAAKSLSNPGGATNTTGVASNPLAGAAGGLLQGLGGSLANANFGPRMGTINDPGVWADTNKILSGLPGGGG